MEILFGANTVFLLTLFAIWKTSTLLNVFIKLVCLTLGISNGIVLLRILGYIVKL